jgi:hypothetical protein
VLVCEGDLAGKAQAELRSLHFRPDSHWLQSQNTRSQAPEFGEMRVFRLRR